MPTITLADVRLSPRIALASVTLSSASGFSSVLLTSLATSGDRITGIPDLAIGDQISYENVLQLAGSPTVYPVTVNADGTFTIAGAPPNDTYTFDVAAFDITDNTWSSYVEQTVVINSSGDMIVDLSGLESAAGIGALIASVGSGAQLAGQASTAGMGALLVSGGCLIELAGQGAASFQGTISASGGVLHALSGLGSTAGIGALEAVTDLIVQLSGLESSVGIGAIGLQTANILTLTGQESIAGQGSLIVSGGGWTVFPDTSTTWNEQIDSATTWVIQ